MRASHRFTHILLRTTDAPGARAFYDAVVPELSGSLRIFPLHEQAIARGARAHWLGLVEVDSVDASREAWTAAGAEPYGPVNAFPDGRRFAVLRDPGGALVGLGSVVEGSTTPFVGADLHALEAGRVADAYAAAFGWRFAAPETHAEHGVLRAITWPEGSATWSGTLVDIAGRSGRHPHWSFHLPVASVEAAVARVRAAGGQALEPVALPDGRRLGVCDDPQGAAFVVCESPA